MVVLTESAARWLLVLHTALGVATVASTTHLVVWMRGYLRHDFGRHRAVKKFAWISVALMLGSFLAGNVMYPTYKVEVRTAYLENAGAIAAGEAVHAQALAHVVEREHAGSVVGATTAQLVTRAAKAARWFDVKEHWIALGLLASAAVLLILAFWDAERDGATFAPIVVGLATIACATVWLGAIIGVLTAAWRAV